MNESLQLLLRFIHKHRFSLPVTLVVSGKTITGMLTPNEVWGEWVSEIIRRSTLDSEGFKIPMNKVPVKARQLDAEEQAATDETIYGNLTLCNATVCEAMPVHDREVQYLSVSVHAVSAFTVGEFPRGATLRDLPGLDEL